MILMFFFVVQYVNDDFKVIFFGSKEEVQKISRVYGSQYEVEISHLKKINKEYQLN